MGDAAESRLHRIARRQYRNSSRCLRGSLYSAECFYLAALQQRLGLLYYLCNSPPLHTPITEHSDKSAQPRDSKQRRNQSHQKTGGYQLRRRGDRRRVERRNVRERLAHLVNRYVHAGLRFRRVTRLGKMAPPGP